MATYDYVPDTTLEAIRNLKPQKVEGLFAMIDGEKVTPTYVWFGIDCRNFRNDPTAVHGLAFYFFKSALYPVYLPNGERFRRADLSDVEARYKDGVLCDYERP